MAARTDLTTSGELREQLLVLRRGTAFYTRQLETLSDVELDGPSLLPGWSRRHVVAHVGYNARALTRLVEWATTGVETPMYTSADERAAEIERGATQPARALRHLHAHAAISLDVSWRDCPDSAWAASVRTAQGRVVPLTETVWMRTREVWLHAIDLAKGAALADVPSDVLHRLMADITGLWAARGLGSDLSVVVTNDRSHDWGTGAVHVAGDLPAVVGWASGRTSALLDEGQGVRAPQWI